MRMSGRESRKSRDVECKMCHRRRSFEPIAPAPSCGIQPVPKFALPFRNAIDIGNAHHGAIELHGETVGFVRKPLAPMIGKPLRNLILSGGNEARRSMRVTSQCV
jgi:hypothetical protein